MHFRFQLTVATVVAAMAMAGGATSVAAQAPKPAAPGVNLLENPGHEHPGAYFDNRGELNVTWSWVPFWQEPPPGVDLRDQNYRTPEFRPPFARDYPERVKSGGGSDRWFNYFALNKAAGVMQVVKNVPVGRPVRFTSHLQLWSSNNNAQPVKSTDDGNLLVRLCIDQDGGPRDLTDPLLVCSQWSQPYDAWRQLSVDGVARNSQVLVFAQTTASLPVEHNDAYMDESCFEILPAAGAKGVCRGNGLVPTGGGAAQTAAAAAATYIPNAGVADPPKRALTPEQQALLRNPPRQTTGAAVPTQLVVTAYTGEAKITSSSRAIVRAGAGTGFKEIGRLTSSTLVKITGRASNGWLRIDFNGQSGFVSAALTDFKAPSVSVPATGTTAGTAPVAVTDATGTAKITSTGRAIVRAGAGTGFREIGRIAPGTTVNVTGRSANGWLRIDFDGQPGFVLATLTDFKP